MVEQLTPEEEEKVLEMNRKFVVFLKEKYGEDILDPIDAVKLKSKLREVYIEHKYKPGKNLDRIRNFKLEALYRFAQECYGLDLNGLSRYKDIETINRMAPEEYTAYLKQRALGEEMIDNAIRMIPILRRQKEEKPLGEK